MAVTTVGSGLGVGVWRIGIHVCTCVCLSEHGLVRCVCVQEWYDAA